MQDNSDGKTMFEPENSLNQDKKKICVKIENGMGDLVTIKASPSTKVEKLLKAYCNKRGVDITNFRLLHRRVELQDKNTLEEMNVSDNDVLNVVSKQIGG